MQLQQKIGTFYKKGQKIKNSKFRPDRKETCRKKYFHEILISIRRINAQKISQIGDDHWSLGRFLQKNPFGQANKILKIIVNYFGSINVTEKRFLETSAI
jgi:hypothetical protein